MTAITRDHTGVPSKPDFGLLGWHGDSSLNIELFRVEQWV
jgi:hypothetical protein